jgi:L-ascorbate metabolism protein UlaG (beta-lactamase superfamily)
VQLSEYLKKIEWLESTHPYGGACIRIVSEQTIYIDPAYISEEKIKHKADVILLTHSHEDHFSIDTLKKLVKPATTIVCPSDCEEALIHIPIDFKSKVIDSGEKIRIDHIEIKSIPAYSSSAHPKTARWIGYLIEIDGFRLYHSGDSGFISEMNDLENIDIAFLTVREPYMMSPNEVIQAVNAFKPKILIPIHWIEEERKDIDYIVKKSPELTKVIILEMK